MPIKINFNKPFFLILILMTILINLSLYGELYVLGQNENTLFLYNLKGEFIDSYEFPVKLNPNFISTNDDIVSVIDESGKIYTLEWIFYKGEYSGVRYFMYVFPKAENIFHAIGPTNYIDETKGDSEFEDFDYNHSFKIKKVLPQDIHGEPILLYFGSGESILKKVNKKYGFVIKQGCGGDLVEPSCPWASVVLSIPGEGLRSEIESRLSYEFDEYGWSFRNIARDIFLENKKVFFVLFGISYEGKTEANVISYDIKSEKVINKSIPQKFAIYLDHKEKNEIFFKNNVLIVQVKSKLHYLFFDTGVIGEKHIKPLRLKPKLKVIDVSKNRQLIILSDGSIYDLKLGKRISFSVSEGKPLRFFYYTH